jgi:translation initiation factor IF-3
MSAGDALKLALEAGQDLIEVAPNANPPVCRITDLGKYKYEQTKREREARKHQHANKLKEIKLRLNIDDHDYETKLNHMRGFLSEGLKVKVSIFFRGRENARPEFGKVLMQRVVKDMADAGRPEMEPRQIGRGMHMMMAPMKGAAKRKQEAPSPARDEDDLDEASESAA